jgi:GLPGLI family protein
MKHIFSATAALLFTICAFAQPQPKFILRGKVEYERKINVHKQLDALGQDMGSFKSNIPKYRTTYFDYHFSGAKSIYKVSPTREGNDRDFRMFGDLNTDNVIFKDSETGMGSSQKSIFEKNYLLQDTLNKFTWRITNDTREIAGFECRKAVGRIFDSVYVIAFYTDEIVNSGGPESYNGLPGLILGVALPRLNTTWFATKVELEVKESDIIIPTKGEKINKQKLRDLLQKTMKDWGKWAQQYILEAAL